MLEFITPYFLTSLPRPTVKCQPVHYARIWALFKYCLRHFNVLAKFTNSLKRYL